MSPEDRKRLEEPLSLDPLHATIFQYFNIQIGVLVQVFGIQPKTIRETLRLLSGDRSDVYWDNFQKALDISASYQPAVLERLKRREEKPQ